MATAAEVEFWKDMCRKESACNNRLRDEWNEAVRQQLAADDARKTAEAVANGLEWQVEELEAENAKLRELVRDMYKAFVHGNCYRWCEFKEPCNFIEDGRCQWYDRMRELESKAIK